MILYHGSNVEIENVDLNKTRKGKDFGKGFYLSADYKQAIKFAHNVVAREGCGVPIVTAFYLNDDIFDSLSIKKFDSYSKEWAEFILKNRNNSADTATHSYDMVIGPIADDRVGTQIRLLMQGYITIDTFIEKIQYTEITFQYFLGTEDAIKYLKKL
jgi:hypothetical protein